MTRILTTEDFTAFTINQGNRIKYLGKIDNNKQNIKLDTLKEKQFKIYGFKMNNNWFINKTDVYIPNEIKWILSLGKKFALPINVNSFSPIHTIADLELCIQELKVNEEKEKDLIRTRLANRITRFKRSLQNTGREKYILTAYRKTKDFLMKHKNIVIIQADKGNKTVALYKEEYKEKMDQLLNDKNTYRQIREDPTKKLLKQNNNIVSDLRKNKCIDDWQKRTLICTAATAPRIYGLPKIHKTGTPLRPIVSSVQVPCYKLSKYIGQILKNLISDKYNIRNSLRLVEQLKDLKIENGEVLISLDVVSLFTNIPINKAINIIMRKWNLLKCHTDIRKPSFLKILNFCLNDNNYFTYDKEFFNQIYGMPMGNPLSPTIADIVLDDLLDEISQELRNKNINIKYITKYVDDFLAIVKIDEKDEILNIFNAYHPKIKFTMETENDNAITFLDTKIYRTKDKLILDWYTKDTSSGRIINFYSTHNKSQIINTAKNFIQRILQLSNRQFHNKNISHIIRTLEQNSFPLKLINTLIETTSRKLNHTMKDSSNDETDKHFYSVRFIPGLTDNKNIKRIIENKNIKFAYRPNITLNTIFTNVKAPIEKQQHNNVVYEIKCNGNNNNNCDLLYIGTTKRSLETRIREHKQDIEKQKQTTALAQHIFDTGHKVDLEGVKILDKESIEKKRYTIESLRIQQKRGKTMNLKQDTDNINDSYTIAIATK